ncbi:MAG: primosomal protein N' [Lachnospiraceae bacterium]
MALYADIIIDISLEKLDRTFQYLVPKELEEKIAVGMPVEVPFGKGGRKITGYVLELSEEPTFDVDKIKPIAAILEDKIPIETELIALAGWMRKNYGGTMNQALKTVIPIKRRENEKQKQTVALALEPAEAEKRFVECNRKNSVARRKLLDALLEQRELPKELITKKLGVQTAVIRALEEQGIVKIISKRDYRNPIRQLKKEESGISLNPSQQKVVDKIWEDIEKGEYHTCLLHGVTGSGKTEVYMELIAKTIEKGRQAIVLIPEIALTYQTVMRFYRRFGERVSIMNSRLSSGERFDQFERAKNGEIDVMIGPRSALFTPFSNLGIIIIDEEHETSYKSETVPKYHARETAIRRAKMAGAAVILGSATPSLESYYRAKQGEYKLLELKERVQKRPLPECHVIDLREELKKGNRSILSTKLQELIEDRLKKRQQIMLFINRRGLSGFISCRACGNVIKCPHCDVSLSQHKGGRLICHYCGYEEAEPALCPECGSKYIGGFKAGTQKIEEIIKKRFPTARTLRMDMDTTRTKDGYENILSAFSNQEADILIGTQMIVKGHDFPNVTLVGVLAADMSLYIHDYHSSERTFQLLTQAAGRAGRGEEAGEVVIQTYTPEHYSITAAKEQNYEAFYEQEIRYRDLLNYPPVWNLLVILISSKEETASENTAKLLAENIEAMQIKMLSVIGPAAPTVAKINDIYRQVIYLKSNRYETLVEVKDRLEAYIEAEGFSGNVNIQFDFNPVNAF